jgi:hypothetical protein
MLLTEFNSSRHAKVIEVHEDEAGTNPMAQAVTRRIMNQHPEWLMKYGPEAVMQAIDDVTEGETDWEEIGSSDVSAYVTYVGDALRDRAGSREEMADRRPFAEEQGVAEGLLGDREYNRVMPFVKRIAGEVSDYDRDEFGEELWSLLDQKYGSKFAQSVLDDLDFYWDTYTELAGQQGVAESLRNGEYHVATVTLDDGTEKKVNLMSDEGFRDQIEKHFAKQGRQVKDIKVDWGVHANESNDRPLAFVAPSKNTDLGYIKLLAHKVKNKKPLSRREKEDLSKYLASNMMKEGDHGDLRTGWVIKAAKRAFPMAATDQEALAMWINDRVEKDVNRLDRENDREDRDIDRLDKENDQEQRMLSQMSARDEQVKKKLNDLQAQVNVLYKANDERKPSRLESRLSTRATSAEISKYLAEMKKAGYDI